MHFCNALDLTLFPMGVGHECFFGEQTITMLMQMEICSCKLNDNSVSSIFKTRRALVLHFVIKNQVTFKFQGILSTIFSDFSKYSRTCGKDE